MFTYWFTYLKKPTKVVIPLTTNENITIHMKLIFPLTPIYIPTKVAMPSTTYEGIAYALHNHLPFKRCLIKPSFYPFMNIHETTFMHVLHTMNQLWCDGDLDDDETSFRNNFIWGNVTWGINRCDWSQPWVIQE
jgi:hypothetical protein